MSGRDEAAQKRSVLLGARIRFSPSGANVRNQAIERIIEQNLASVEVGKGLTEQQLQNLVTLGGQIAVLRALDVRQGIESLKQSKRVQEIPDGKKRLYALSQNAKNEAMQVIAESEERTATVIRELFANAVGGEKSYERAFLRLLCLVFSKLSEGYVQVITMKEGEKEIAEHHLLPVGLEETLKRESVPDAEAFRYGVNRFFRESTPDFDRIKWNMAQNFYVAKALGLDAASDLLSSDIFRDASLYCDTNVLIAGLTPESRHHNSFQEVAKACMTIPMTLKATHATVEELKNVINAHASLLRKVLDRIPEEMKSRVRNFLLEGFLAIQEKTPGLSFEEFFLRFQEPLKTLRDSFGLTEEDDRWFDNAAENQDAKALGQELSRQYEEMRGRRKLEYAAIHDAILLLWVARENEAGRKSWVVTLDMTLAAWNAHRRRDGFRIITLDAFLQWMTPVAPGAADEDKIAEIFAEAIRYQLLPRDTFFQLRDFQVFAEMGIETKQLPASDVEACIREVRLVGPQLDPSRAEDREKLGQIIQRYFADPGTKYQRAVQELQSKTESLAKSLDDEARLRREADQKIAQLDGERRDGDEKLRQLLEARKEAEDRIAALQQAVKEEKQKAYRTRLLISGILRSSVMLILLAALEAGIGVLVWHYGKGANLFQKLTEAWHWLALGFSIVVIAYPFVMGRERMRLLKWWKGDSDTGEWPK